MMRSVAHTPAIGIGGRLPVGRRHTADLEQFYSERLDLGQYAMQRGLDQ
jgi:hypothetical protein